MLWLVHRQYIKLANHSTWQKFDTYSFRSIFWVFIIVFFSTWSYTLSICLSFNYTVCHIKVHAQFYPPCMIGCAISWAFLGDDLVAIRVGGVGRQAASVNCVDLSGDLTGDFVNPP